MIILSICDNHDSGACVLQGGIPLSAINEERLSRDKLQGGFPRLSANRCIVEAGISPKDIDVIVFASRMTPAALLRLVYHWHGQMRRNSSSFSYLLNLYIMYQVTAHYLKVPEYIEELLSRAIIARRIKDLGVIAPLVCVGHHDAHAAAAYYTSGSSERAIVFTVDAMGDALSVTVSVGEGRQLHRVYAQSGLSSVSTYYQRLTEFLGFVPSRHEGKITSLAGYGKLNTRLLKLAQERMRFCEKNKGFTLKNHLWPESPQNTLHRELREYSTEDVAFNFQKNFEDELTRFISFWVVKLGISRVYVSGGVFANVSLNQRIKDIEGVSFVYVFPHMGDGGLALGAALAHAQPVPFYLPHVYWGPAYSTKDIQHVISASGLVHEYMEEEALCFRVAKLLADGKTVAHFNGAMEFGPRALGNRSILYRADDISAREWLNDKMKRSRFMPFAPVSLEEEAGELYVGIEKAKYALRFMTMAVDCTSKLKELCPGSVHIDGTARPQLLSEKDNPRVWRILKHYKHQKGIGTLINTSFNRHEEPIVCSPRDALQSFLECDLDVLVLNNFIVQKSGK